MNILGITRSKQFSPNMVDKDLAIMKAVASRLECQGHQVWLVDELDWVNKQTDDNLPDAIFTMMRSREALKKLRRMENEDVPSLNSADGIMNAHREYITKLMRTHGIPIPTTVFSPEEPSEGISFPCWVKQGSGWAQDKDDVVFVENKTDFDCHLSRLNEKYPDGTVVVAEHLEGDLVKFYGVEGTDFFFWSYPDPSKSKFGLESINGVPVHTSFDADQLKTVCDKVAELSHIRVYGGDCVVGHDGAFRIIDFNDWPSFSSCREQAAEAIASKILNLQIINSKS